MIWLVKIIETSEGLDFSDFGIFPRRLNGLPGILLTPFIHSNFNHLINNTVPFFLLLTSIFYFYHKVAWRVLLFSYVITGILVWFVARPAYHIGASGQVYSFAAFVFVSGIIRRNINLLAISLLVIFLYGSMVWGIFPYQPDMSWESHLAGLTVGVVLAIIFRHEGPGPTITVIEQEDGEEEEEEETINSDMNSDRHPDKDDNIV